ncbi:hypothetical protein BCV70DRAFT_202190 [Testicularia cyperi]|uniref:Rho-GAP domain-containing protein n=1 Tax=Testicularia cyperi TaxID=1882483 RepID=A0A317XID2_9BASI|nr:hypothetical protein BCV70DRAFT_202190 [Testicularia cyperi]
MVPQLPHAGKLEAHEDSPDSTAFATPISTPSGHHTPAAGYRTATGTLSAAFASLWGTYNQQQKEAGPSRSPVLSSAQLQPQPPPRQSSASIPGGWGNLLSWGPAAARQHQQQQHPQPKYTPPSGRPHDAQQHERKSVSPSRASARGRARAAIPFGISSPLEAASHEADEETTHHARFATARTSPDSSPTDSPRRKSLHGLFDDQPSISTGSSPSAPRSPTSPRRAQFRDLPQSPASPKSESPSGAYATLSRLQSKSSSGALRSGSGFLWSNAATGASASASSFGDASSPSSLAKPAADWSQAIARVEKLDSYVRRIVFQAGLDYETRPMVVLAACCLPDPKEVDYDALLDRIMDTMDLFVENDYTVIYFAGGARHRPGWNWIWRAYRRLGRKFRKNLKKLYIVHPTFFTRSLLQFVNTGAYFVSPKFSKKVSQLYTLSALAENVPLTQIDIPPEVLQWNLKYEKQVTIPQRGSNSLSGEAGEASRVFGVDLVQLMGEYGECGGVPRVVRDCVEAILGDFDGIKPYEIEGIFRRSPSSALLRTAQESYDRGHPVSLVQYRDPHIPAVLLKVFLRSLPRPVFPASLYGLIRACPPPPMNNSTNSSPEGSDVDDRMHQARSQDTIDYLRTRLLPAIQPPCSGILLSYVLEMLHKVSQHSDINKMDAANLATVIAPNLVSSGNAIKDVMLCRVEGIGSMAGASSSMAASPSPSPRSSSPTQFRKASSGGGHVEAHAHTTTLGSILRFCIERYYEIFDEMSFEPQVSHAQDIVDDLARGDDDGSRSPSVHSRVSALASEQQQQQHAHYSNGHLDRAGLGIEGRRATSHRRGNSAASTGSGLSASQPSSPWITGFTPSHSAATVGGGIGDDDEDRRSIAASRSITSREGYRPPGGIHRGTIGRNSSGSLRLTKGRLGSNNNLRGSFTPVTPTAFGGGAGVTALHVNGGTITSSSSANGRTASGSGTGSAAAAGSSLGLPPSSSSGHGMTHLDTEGLTSQLSGVMLTGAQATGMFASPVADRFVTPSSAASSPHVGSFARVPHDEGSPTSVVEVDEEDGGAHIQMLQHQHDHRSDSTSSSPSSVTLLANNTESRREQSLLPTRRKSLRRELSEVVEADADDDDDEAHNDEVHATL